MIPADVVNEAGVTVTDVGEYLDHDEWEVALDLLADLHTGLATFWRHLHPGRTITMHEGRPAAGTATVIEASNAR